MEQLKTLDGKLTSSWKGKKVQPQANSIEIEKFGVDDLNFSSDSVSEFEKTFEEYLT